MGSGVRSYGEELVAVLSAATDVVRDLPGRVHALTGADLDVVLPVVDALAAAAGAGRFTLTAEAVTRGEVAGSQAGSVPQWVADRCPSLDGREAGLVAKAVRELAGSGTAGSPALAGALVGALVGARAGALVGARAAVAEGRLSVSAGCVVAAELAQLTPLVEPGAVDAVAAGLVAMGQVDGPAGVRRVRPALLARYGLGQVLQDVEDRHRGLTVLSCGHDIGGGITEYRLRLNPEARAVVEAAINTASAPRPADETRDVRTMDQRRGDALVDLCRRAGHAGHGGHGGHSSSVADGGSSGPAVGAPSGVKATVLVTIGLDDLRDRTRPGVVVGGLDGGSLLGPETVRKLACDAAVVPAVLGADGQVLDLGRTRRLFSPAQVQALWLRDRHCTFPGCPTPASWCDAHHVTHWVDGGPTNLGNAALLCGRHHTIVHRDRLTATLTANLATDGDHNDVSVTGPHVAWDRRPGSYDHALARGPSSGGPEP